MLVSIITATYNSAATIEDCMASVLGQDYPHIEYLIMDGASTDSTLDIVEKAAAKDARIKVYSAPDYGVYDALNKGIAIAKGDVVGVLHSDDLFANSQIITAVVDALKRTNIDGVYGDLEYVTKTDISKVIRYWKSCNYNSKFLLRGWMPPHPTLFLRTSVYTSHGIYNTAYNIAADYDYILRLFKDKDLVFEYLPMVITKMRIGGISNKNLKSIVLKTKEDYKIITQNNFSKPLYTLLFKNLRKLKQFRRLLLLVKK